MNSLRCILPYSILLTVLLSAFVSGCQRSPEEPTSKTGALPILDVKTLLVTKQVWPRVVRSQGSLFPDEEATLGIKVEGRVAQVHIDLGDVVKAGDPLITITQDDFKLRVKQAEAQLAQARSAVGLKPGESVASLLPENAPPAREQKAAWDEAIANLERARVLHRKKVMGQAEFDQVVSLERVAAARYASALNNVREKMANITVQQAELDLAKQDLQNTVLKATYPAVVQERLVAPGSYIKTGDPLLVLVRIDQLRYRGTVPERLATLLKVDQPIEIDLGPAINSVKTKISRISPFIDQMSRSLLFEAVVDNTERRLRAGLFAEGKIIVDGDRKAMIVPLSSVVQFAGTEKVWKVEDGQIQMQVVTLGEQRGDRIRIIAGLHPGDIILQDAEEGRPGVLAKTNEESHQAQATRQPS